MSAPFPEFTPSRRERGKGKFGKVSLTGDAPVPAKPGRDRIIRADNFTTPANKAKVQVILDYWPDWRHGLIVEAVVARKDLVSGHSLRTVILAGDEAQEPAIVASKVTLGAARQQMVRAQAVGVVASWISNRKNEFKESVQAVYGAPPRHIQRRMQSMTPAAREKVLAANDILRHELYAINAQDAWFLSGAEPVNRKLEDGSLVEVSERSRRIARALFQGLMTQHSWPRFRRLTMRFDSRAGYEKKWLEPAKTSARFSWWLHLDLKGEKIALPIRGWGRKREDVFGPKSTGMEREGALGNTVLISLDSRNRLQITLSRDMTEVFALMRANYRPGKDMLGLDFGLRTMFASNYGDLVGRNWMLKLMPLQDRANAIAAKEQKAGRKPNQCPAYRDIVSRIRGFIETEINRHINYLVALHRPRAIAVEKLDFRGSNLSRRMNRLLSMCGRAAVRKKLMDLKQRLGVEIFLVNPAYTSQTCSCCGYVDSKQRSGEKFSCRACGMRKHADVNGACNIALAALQGDIADADTLAGRSGKAGGVKKKRDKAKKAPRAKDSLQPRSKSLKLRDLVRRYDEIRPVFKAVSKPRRGRTGARESAPDPRLQNPYWKRHSLLLKRAGAEG